MSHKRKLRARALKKSLCGLLENVLVRQHKSRLTKRAREQYEFRLRVRSLVVWKWTMPELR